MDGAPLALPSFKYAAPLRDKRLYAFNVLRCADNRQPLKCFPVDLDLTRKSIESILGALDLIAVHAAIYDRHIYSASRMRQAQFINDNGIWQRSQVLQFLPMQRRPDSSVIGREHGSNNDLPAGSLSWKVVPDLWTPAKSKLIAG